MEFSQERARSYIKVQRIVIVFIMVISTILIGAAFLRGGTLFSGPGSIQLSAILFLSLITIMVLASIPTLFIKRRIVDEVDDEVLVWDEDDFNEEILPVDMVKSGSLQ